MGKTMKWFGGFVVGAALFFSSASPAAASEDLAADLNDLATAVDTRVAAIESGRELGKLKRIAKRLGRATIADTSSNALRSILTGVYASKTEDEDVLAAAFHLVDHIVNDAQEAQSEVQDVIDQLDLATKTRLDRRLVRSNDKLSEAASLALSDPARALRLASVARRTYARTQKTASRLAARLEATFGCGRLKNATRLIARMEGQGFERTINAFAIGESFFGQISVQGCVSPVSGASCRDVVNFTLNYSRESTQTGPVGVNLMAYTGSSDFGGGQGSGVQDLRWEAFSGIDVKVSQSSGSRIKGCFSATLTASGEQQPQTITIRGTFVIKRPRADAF